MKKFTLQDAKACLKSEKDIYKEDGCIMDDSSYHIYTKDGEYIYISDMNDCSRIKSLNISEVIFVEIHSSCYCGDTVNGEYLNELDESIKCQNIVNKLLDKYGIYAEEYTSKSITA
jgi:hypothetical protein